MKFAIKIMLGTTFIIALLFSVFGILSISRNFETAYQAAVNAAEDDFRMKQYSLESNIRNAMENGQNYSNNLVISFAGKMEQYEGKERRLAVLSADYEIMYTSLRQISEELLSFAKEGGSNYRLHQSGENTYVWIASSLQWGSHQVYLLTQTDISQVYQERSRQLTDFYRAEALVLCAAVLFTYFLSRLLTRDIKKLSRVSAEISRGDYEKRVQIQSRDEIGELGHHFNVMAETVESHVRELERQVQIRDEFVADFSHELKTPMTAMMGYSKMLQEDSLDAATAKKAVTYIYQECRRLEHLSKRLLMLLGLSQERLQLQTVEASWLASQTANLWRAGRKEPEANLQIDVEHAYLQGDASLLQDLLRNLLDNAALAVAARRETEDAAFQGKICLRGCITQEKKYLFQVSDNGIGMKPEEVKRATETFYMADKSRSRKAGGSGIGLSICQRICQLHLSQLEIESTYGEGCRVGFLLLLEEVEPNG